MIPQSGVAATGFHSDNLTVPTVYISEIKRKQAEISKKGFCSTSIAVFL